MRLPGWLKTNFRLRTWMLFGMLGFFVLCFGISFLIKFFLPQAPAIPAGSIFIISGGFLLVLSIRNIIKKIYSAIIKGEIRNYIKAGRFSSIIFDKRITIKGPKIVTVGGGTGLSAMLRGLKAYSSNLTAIVTVADDGGGSGILRQDLGMLPPGDIRNCIVSLANTEPMMESLLQYRFKDGMLKGQSFGNLFLAAMDGISSNFEEAVRRMSDVLAVTGRVLPVTLEDVRLSAELEDGFIVCGESNIGKHNGFHPGKINKVYLEPVEVKPLHEVLEAINEADVIVLGPGSLYTSVIPNLLIPEVQEALKASKAPKVYVLNIMTQPGETDAYTLYDHIAALEKHSFKGIVNYCIVNTASIPDDLGKKYFDDGARAVVLDMEKTLKHGVKVIGRDLVGVKNNYIRHDPAKLAEAVISFVD